MFMQGPIDSLQLSLVQKVFFISEIFTSGLVKDRKNETSILFY